MKFRGFLNNANKIAGVLVMLSTIIIAGQNFFYHKEIMTLQRAAEHYNYSTNYSIFWKKVQNFQELQIKTTKSLLKNAGLSLVALEASSSVFHSPDLSHEAAIILKKDTKNSSNPNEYISLIGGTLVAGTQLMINSQSFILQNEKVAQALHIKGWSEFKNETRTQNEKLSRLILSLHALLDMRITALGSTPINTHLKEHVTNKIIKSLYTLWTSYPNISKALLRLQQENMT